MSETNYQTDKIYLTGNNYDASTRSFRIKFQKGQRFNRETHSVALSELSLYNSFFNISTEYNNTLLQMIWQGTTYNIQLENNSFLSIEDINFVIQTWALNNGFYCEDTATNQNVFFFDIQSNSSLYKCQLSSYLLQQNAEGTLVIKGNWSFDNSLPRLIIPDGSQLTKFFGLASGTYPSLATTQSTVILSSSAPDINQVSSILFGTNICFSQNGIQEDSTANVIYSRAIDVAFGAPLVSSINSDSHFLSCQTGIFNYLSITLMDQDFRILEPHDLQCIISIIIRKKVVNISS